MTIADDDPEAWMARSKQRGALRLLGIGISLLVAGGVDLASVKTARATRGSRPPSDICTRAPQRAG